jgi:hypothetical protein
MNEELKKFANSLGYEILELSKHKQMRDSIYEKYEKYVGFSIIQFQRDSHYLLYKETSEVHYVGDISGCQRFLKKYNLKIVDKK